MDSIATDTPHYPYKLPQGWEWCFIGDIAFVTKLAGFEYTNYIADNLSSSGVPLFKGKNIQNSEISYDFESYIPESISDELSRSQITKKCLLTPYVGTIGNIGIHNKKGKFHLGSNVGKIEILNSDCIYVYEEYIKLYLQSLVGYKQLTKTKKSTAQESISIEAIRSVLVPIPPTTEQERIIAKIEFIENFLHLIDYEVHNMGEKLNQAKSKILELAVTGKLVPQNPDDEPAAELLKRINPDAEIVTDNGQCQKLPDSWVICQLGDIFNHNTGKALNSSNQEGELLEYITTSNVYWTHFEIDELKLMRYKLSEIEKCQVTKGDLLVCEGGDIGRSAIWNYDWDVMIQNHIHRLRSIQNCASHRLYYYIMMLYKSKDMIGGKGMGLMGLSSKALHQLIVPFPPREEQYRIVAKIEELFSALDIIKDALQA